MTRIAFLFPGQGSQQVGMGRDLVREIPLARELFEVASEASGLDVQRACLRGPLARLSRTDVLQPALTAMGLACARGLIERGVTPHAAAGHSVGELPALACAGSFTDTDAVMAAAARGRAMHEASTRTPGTMLAVSGLRPEAVAEALDGVLALDQGGIAAINAPSQVVVSAAEGVLADVRRVLTARGARLSPLAVSGAWHCALMDAARTPYADTLEGIPLAPPTLPVPMNAAGEVCSDPGRIRGLLVEQLCRPVQWVAVVQALIDEGVDGFVELGSGTVLRGLLRRIHPDPAAYQVFCVGDLRALGHAADALTR